MQLSRLFLRRSAGAVVACAALLSPVARSQPAAPVVTAWGDTKQLKFDWDPVPNTDYYELLFHAPGSTVTFFTLSPAKTAATNNIAVHLFDWDRWSYGVTACNRSGACSEGRPPVTMKSLMQDTIGYIKSSVPRRNASFGFRVAISEDGNTIATMTHSEPAGASHAAPFYVFTKIAGKWRQQARIFPSSNETGRYNLGFNSLYAPSLALSQDGNTLLLAMPFKDAANRAYQSVMVYRRADGAWTREFQVVSQVTSNPQESLEFALMNAAGTRIFYRLRRTDPIHLVERGASGWVERTTGQPPSGASCSHTKFSGDGNTLAYLCGTSGGSRVFLARAPDFQPVMATFVPVAADRGGTALAINYDVSRIAVTGTKPGEYENQAFPNEVRVFRVANGAWQQFGQTLHAGSWTSGYSFGEELEFSKSGSYLVVFDGFEGGQGTGVLSPPLVPMESEGRSNGAFYIYEFPASGPRLRRVVKPNDEDLGGFLSADFALANDGRTLLIGDPAEDSKSAGIDGNRQDDSLPGAGALWLY